MSYSTKQERDAYEAEQRCERCGSNQVSITWTDNGSYGSPEHSYLPALVNCRRCGHTSP